MLRGTTSRPMSFWRCWGLWRCWDRCNGKHQEVETLGNESPVVSFCQRKKTWCWNTCPTFGSLRHIPKVPGRVSQKVGVGRSCSLQCATMALSCAALPRPPFKRCWIDIVCKPRECRSWRNWWQVRAHPHCISLCIHWYNMDLIWGFLQMGVPQKSMAFNTKMVHISYGWFRLHLFWETSRTSSSAPMTWTKKWGTILQPNWARSFAVIAMSYTRQNRATANEGVKKGWDHFWYVALPIGSMVLVYMLTWLGYIDGVNVTIYSIHGSYGLCFSDWCKQKTPSLVLRLSGHCMEWRSGHVWTKFHIAWWKAVLGHGYALRLCQQWRQREGLTAFDSWNPGFSRVLTSSECQRYLCKAACTMLKCFNIPHTVFFV